MNHKITFPELVDAIATLTNTSKRVSEQFMKELFGVIKERLEQGETVKVKGLGVFKVNEIASRKSVNVNTGEEMEIPSHRRVGFTPDKSLAEAINMPFEGFETVMLDDDLSEEDLTILASVVGDKQSDEPDLQQKEVEILPKEEEPQPPIFVEREELDVDLEEKTEMECRTEIELASEADVEVEKDEKEPIAILVDKDETLEDSLYDKELDEDTESHAEEEYVITYDDEEMRHAKRYSFAWGVLSGIFVATIGFALFYYYVLIANVKVDDTDYLMAETQEPLAIAADSLDKEKDTIIVKTDSVNTSHDVLTDTVRTNYFLTKMARKYYGSYEFWVYIYEENKAKISNPNQVSPGLVVVIPPAEKYGIDKDNPESVARAKEKAAKLQ